MVRCTAWTRITILEDIDCMGIDKWSDRIWKRIGVGSSDDCWNWIGATKRFRGRCYPINFYQDGKSFTPAAYILMLFGITKEQDNFVVHYSCGNTLCCNPKHLVWGNRGRYTRDSIAHFWERVNIKGEDDCWDWTGATTGRDKNYGTVVIGSKHIYTHRLAYKLKNGELIKGLVIRHTCNNPICCNPKHLIQGTFKENTHDALDAGRMAYQRMIPVKKYRLPYVAKLAKRDVLEILAEKKKGTSQRTIAKIWDVSESMISRIVNRNRHLDITISA